MGGLMVAHSSYKMTMLIKKHILKFALAFLPFLSQASFAQGSAVLLYPEYQKGTIFMAGKQQVRVQLNYDAANHCVMYQQNGENMILTNPEAVDSMKIGNNLFCRVKDKFYEVVSYPQGRLLIDWDLDKVNVGYKGAFGTVSQAHSQSVKLSLLEGQEQTNNSPDSNQDVYKVKNHNKYQLVKGDKLKSFSSKKSLLKLFPGKTEEVETIIKNRQTDFAKADDIIQLIGDLLPLF